MENNELEFLKRLKDTFRVEATDHLRSISNGLLEMEKTPSQDRWTELTESVFRESHSLKGAARSVNLKTVESLCRAIESVFSALKHGSATPSAAMFDLLHTSMDIITGVVSSAEMEGSASDSEAARVNARSLEEILAEPSTPTAETGTPVAQAPSPGVNVPTANTMRVSVSRIDEILVQAEELVTIKLSVRQRRAELLAAQQSLQAWKDETSSPSGQQSSTASPRREERLQRDEALLGALSEQVTTLARNLGHDQYSINRMVDEHLESIKKAVMVPVSSLVEIFPKLIRDLARDQGKEVESIVLGAEVECDKRILEELKDPLIHLVRNAIDHGIQGAAGKITIAIAVPDSSHMEIRVSDDGVGIDPARVREAAIKSGIITRESAEKLDFDGTVALAFLSGVSTSPIITDISGCGLGLAIVREKVEGLGGSVAMNSRPHEGTTVRMLLPLTRSTFRGVLVRVTDREFIVPTVSVERISSVLRSAITMAGDKPMVRIDDVNYPVVDMAGVLGLTRRIRNGSPAGPLAGRLPDRIFVAILATANHRIAFQVDELVDELEVIQKSLGSMIQRMRNISGAVILGNGAVVPVLNVSDLVKSALLDAARTGTANKASKDPESAEPSSRIPKILVADDSITARSFLKNLLETAGYMVSTAVDGADAYARAIEGDFDLVVSDVDMPRMSGFELCTRIRGEKRLSALPVVLVTALESRDDHERGIDAGADAYIVKSSFEHSNLLEVVRRLL